MSSVLVARFAGRSEIAAILRAALEVEIVYVALPSLPAGGRHELKLFDGDVLVARISAELVGSGRGGEYPLRVGLLDPAAAADVEALATRRSLPPGGDARASHSVGPRPSRKSLHDAKVEAQPALASPAKLPQPFDGEQTLTSRAAPRKSLRAAPLAETTSAPPASAAAAQAFDRERVVSSTGDVSSSDDITIPRASVPQRRVPVYTDDESQTEPGRGSRGDDSSEVSWNVRLAPTTKDPLCGRTINGKYVLDSVIGTGAIGIVFKASHRDLGRTVAIKVLNPRARDDEALLQVFRAEARAASLLEHPNVARVYDYGQEPDGLVYIVMEYLSGYTLGSVLGARRKLTTTRALEVMVQICAALTAAHDQRIVHRDIKPDNIVLVPAHDDEGRPMELVKVCDFGIAALGTTTTEDSIAVGTPEYMAPEQTTGLAVSAAADVYACGVVLYQMLLGEVPFTADQAFRIMIKQRSEAPRPPSSLDPAINGALEQVILRCLAKEPTQRYQTARELRLELRRISAA